jgi:hypothetical protein
VDSALEIRSRAAGKKDRMLCPCCGSAIKASDKHCGCGARFVGLPLDAPPIKVQKLGPAMTSVLLLVLVVCLTLIFTKWLGLGVVVVAWCARRATILAGRDPVWYGGYRTAKVIFSVSTASALVFGAVALLYIPRCVENYSVRQEAATRASMHHVASVLEDYKATCGSYPKDAQEYKKVLNESLPADFWEKKITYQSSTALAENDASPLRMAGLPMINFELRSSGPDGIDGTDDDIIMIDGVFMTAAEARKQATPTRPPMR